MPGLAVTIVVSLLAAGGDDPRLTDKELAAELARLRAELAATRREAERLARREHETRKLVRRVELRLKQHGIRPPDQADPQPDETPEAGRVPP
ncbi:MAG: hypothetical protein R3200_10270 [Xanthomonadales bacterium]|nr:hypothetical protein [Xanthomonadales bacterium]